MRPLGNYNTMNRVVHERARRSTRSHQGAQALHPLPSSHGPEWEMMQWSGRPSGKYKNGMLQRKKHSGGSRSSRKHQEEYSWDRDKVFCLWLSLNLFLETLSRQGEGFLPSTESWFRLLEDAFETGRGFSASALN